MMSTRTTITLGYTKREEVERGVWEDARRQNTVKAEEQQIFQSRKDRASLEGKVITARFEIRSHHIQGALNYVEWKNAKYKVNGIYPNNERHFTIIEIGELV